RRGWQRRIGRARGRRTRQSDRRSGEVSGREPPRRRRFEGRAAGRMDRRGCSWGSPRQRIVGHQELAVQAVLGGTRASWKLNDLLLDGTRPQERRELGGPDGREIVLDEGQRP